MNRMRELVDRLNETAYQYYTLDDPTISDKEWDALYDELVKLEAETGERLPDSPTRRRSSGRTPFRRERSCRPSPTWWSTSSTA